MWCSGLPTLCYFKVRADDLVVVYTLPVSKNVWIRSLYNKRKTMNAKRRLVAATLVGSMAATALLMHKTTTPVKSSFKVWFLECGS